MLAALAQINNERAAAAAERETLQAHQRQVEDRAYGEVHRLRRETKALKQQLATQAREQRPPSASARKRCEPPNPPCTSRSARPPPCRRASSVGGQAGGAEPRPEGRGPETDCSAVTSSNVRFRGIACEDLVEEGTSEERLAAMKVALTQPWTKARRTAGSPPPTAHWPSRAHFPLV